MSFLLNLFWVIGFTVVEEDGDSIPVASEALPAEGDVVTIKGTLRKNLLIGYYIETEN